MTASAKSPLTGCIGDAQCGGFFPAEMKFAGFDAIILKGRAATPVYLWIHHGQAELRPASHLWGHVTGEVDDILKQELGDSRIEVLQVGPAGENGVRFAAIMNMSNRANGRTGMGAVMGSKNLKAVVVRGTHKPSLADKETLNRLARWGAEHLPKSDVAGLAKYGTAETTGAQQVVGGLPTRNWASGVFDEGWQALNGPTMYDTILRGADQGQQDRYGRDTCYACTVRCKRVVEHKEGADSLHPQYGGPEYETTSTLGCYCGVGDLLAVAKAAELCNQYGMDTISCGATIAWAMECYEAGLLTLQDTGGLELRFGNAEAVIKMVEMMARREGFGDVLAEGSAGAASRLGRGQEFLICSKNQEAPAHMPQLKRSLALIYAVNPFGADHQSHEHDPAYKPYPVRMAQLGLMDPQPDLALNAEIVRFALVTQHFYSLTDSVNVCQFVYGPAWHLYDSNQLVEVVEAVTGWDTTLYELMKVGERRLNMMRAFNAREGIGRAADTLPDRFFDRPLQGGPSDGYVLDRDEWRKALDTYYGMCGWDVTTGYPTRATLEGLSIGWVADELGL
jgi:aldehyde:ferredoxin oxidoreductase